MQTRAPLLLLLAGVACGGPAKGPPAPDPVTTSSTSTSTDPSCTDPVPWYADADGDGFGKIGAGVYACEAPAGSVVTSGDCNDADADVHPDGEERCNGLDDDCDGAVDVDAVDADTWHADADEDGFGSDLDTQVGCVGPPGWVGVGGDCNDSWAHVNPDVEEVCNGWDDDCDSGIDDDAIDRVWAYPDLDGDGFGDESAAQLVCAVPSDHVEQAGDCDDAADWSYPGAPEVCDGAPNDCGAAWTSDAGIVSARGNDGTWFDLTAAALAGTAEAPAELALKRGELLVCAGHWYTTLVAVSFNQVTVTGVDGAEVTQLDAGSSTLPPLAAYGTVDLVVSGLTLRGGATGLLADGVGSLTVADVRIEQSGVGLSVTQGFGSLLTVDGVDVVGTTGRAVVLADLVGTLTDLTVSSCGGGVRVSDGADVTLTGGVIADNTAVAGAGLDVDRSTVRLDGTEVSSNTATGEGGGLRVADGEVELTGVLLSDNVAVSGGGLSLTGSTATVTGCDFVSNTPDDTFALTSQTWGLGATFTCDAAAGCL